MSASLGLTPPATTADDPKASVRLQDFTLAGVGCPLKVDGGTHLLISEVDNKAVAFEAVSVV